MSRSQLGLLLVAPAFFATLFFACVAGAQEKAGPLPETYDSAPPPPVYKAAPGSPSGYEVVPSAPPVSEKAPVPSMYRTTPSAPSAPATQPVAPGQQSIPVAPSAFDAAPAAPAADEALPVAPPAQQQMPSPTAYETAPAAPSAYETAPVPSPYPAMPAAPSAHAAPAAAPPGVALPSAAPVPTRPAYVPPTISPTWSEDLAPWKPADEGDFQTAPAQPLPSNSTAPAQALPSDSTAPAQAQRSNSKVAFGDTVEERNRVFERVDWATEAYEDLITAPDRGVPESLLAEARCVGVIPHVVKAAVFVGLRYGKGILTCRNEFGEWSPIVFITLGGPSVGFQWGAQATDVVLFFRRERGVHRLLSTKVTLGGDASIAAGPVGRRASAEVDVTLTTDVLSYARNKGVFLGVSLEGSYLGIDGVSNEHFYGAPVDPAQLLFAPDVNLPAESAQRLLALLP